ncbi:MAG: metalloregulator ArsR/SmtB family transcription factor [Gemmatimonadota bacterium]|jgi:DNA-binding transcriptional ArsR family regulator
MMRSVKGPSWQTISIDAIQEAARILKCIGHPVRLEILAFLDASGEQTVSAICEAVERDQPVVSRHLTLMRDKGILASRREGVNVYYRMDDERVVQVLDCLRACQI